MEKELNEEFNHIFLSPSRKPIVALNYDADVCRILSVPEKLRYFSRSGNSIDEAVNQISKVALPDNMEKLIIDISCSLDYSPSMDEMEAISKLIEKDAFRDADAVWGVCKDSEQQERVIIRLLMSVKPKEKNEREIQPHI